jgi:hypothetical protein
VTRRSQGVSSQARVHTTVLHSDGGDVEVTDDVVRGVQVRAEDIAGTGQ